MQITYLYSSGNRFRGCAFRPSYLGHSALDRLSTHALRCCASQPHTSSRALATLHHSPSHDNRPPPRTPPANQPQACSPSHDNNQLAPPTRITRIATNTPLPQPRNPAHLPQDYQLEWDRTLSAVLGVANNRLYTLRLQTPTGQYKPDSGALRDIMDSFRCREVEA